MLCHMAVEISRASRDRLTPLASVLGRSFVVEPMLRWSLGDHADIAERFTTYFANGLKGDIPRGIVWEAGDADGVAIWVPPDGAEVWQEVQSRDARVEGLTLDGGRRHWEFWEWVESRMPDQPLWELDSIAVEPEVRGLGTARR